MESAVTDVIRIGGLELRFLVDETQGSGDLVIFEMTVQPNARVPVAHYHREVDEITQPCGRDLHRSASNRSIILGRVATLLGW